MVGLTGFEPAMGLLRQIKSLLPSTGLGTQAIIYFKNCMVALPEVESGLFSETDFESAVASNFTIGPLFIMVGAGNFEIPCNLYRFDVL